MNLISKLIIAAIVVPCLVLFLLHKRSKANENKANGFTRKFISNALIEKGTLKDSLIYGRLSGEDSISYYFQTKSPKIIIATDKFFNSNRIIELPLTSTDSCSAVFLSYFYHDEIKILDKKLRKLIVHNLCTNNTLRYSFNNHLTQGIPLDDNSIIIRSDFEMAGVHKFQKINTLTSRISVENNVSDHIQDGGISTNGMLHFNKFDLKIYYVHYYMNRVICMDTSLNLVTQWSTIDTFSTSTIVPFKENKFNQTTYTTSNIPKYVNGYSVVSDSLLFINSQLRGDNESITEFSENSVIDIYTLRNGEYIGSFYIPPKNGRKMISFEYTNETLLVFYRESVFSYEFSPSLQELY